jgi:hypothetical protein
LHIQLSSICIATILGTNLVGQRIEQVTHWTWNASFIIFAFQVIFGIFAKLVKTRSEQVAIGACIADD